MVNQVKMWWRRLRGGTAVTDRPKDQGDPPTTYDSKYAERAEKVVEP